MKGAILQKVTEILDGEIHGKQFPVEVLYPVSVGFIFFEKKAMGYQ